MEAIESNCIVFVLVFFAGIFKAVMDTLQFHYTRSVFGSKVIYTDTFWDPNISWMNKYKPGTKIPKFFGSTTLFVFVTDAWHLTQMLLYTFIFAAVSLSNSDGSLSQIFIIFVISRLSFSISFNLFYSYILLNK